MFKQSNFKESRFAFGKNWAQYINFVDRSKIEIVNKA